jgi:hypothetical protein
VTQTTARDEVAGPSEPTADATADDAAIVEHDPAGGPGYHAEIFAISFAALLLEIAYTRVVSFKLFYYYTYLVIGLALLGLGAGAVLMAVSPRLKRARTDAILITASLVAAVGIAVSYLVVARLGIASLKVWDYGTRASFSSLARLVVICLALFASFVGIGVMLATLFGRRTAGIGRLYFADLLGAGIGCALAVWLISAIGPPRMILLAALVLALVAVRIGIRGRRRSTALGAVVAAGLLVPVVFSGVLPDVKTDDAKGRAEQAQVSRWSPIFRVDAIGTPPPPGYTLPRTLLLHDGTLGSIIQPWDGTRAGLRLFHFDTDPRSFPFAVLQRPKSRVMIIGAAGGHEILASKYYGASKVDAIELNPATYDLVTKDYADYDGHIAEQPGVNYVNGDGRSFLARTHAHYDLVWYPAPDSYSATNASTAGAFVLSESYLYTTEAIRDSLEHLDPGGILAAQFGEIDYTNKPNRTTRYVATAREALDEMGISHPGDHVLVSTAAGVQSTVLVKKTPFTAEEIRRFTDLDRTVPGTEVRYAPGRRSDPRLAAMLTLSRADRDRFLAAYRYDVSPIDDDAPFFWHFSPFSTVLRNYDRPISGSQPDLEDSIGERVLLLLLGIAAVLAAVFLLVPFLVMKKTWRRLPRKAISAVYFAMLGLGFMFFEITLIQRLILFLGFPTYSLTVTLASLLIFTGVGSLASSRIRDRVGGRVERLAAPLAVVIAVLGAGYLFGLPALTDALLSTPLWARFATTFVVLAPLGVCLGLFMPLGLGAVSDLSEHGAEYVAWSWAVNGFASVVGSVLTTVIAMSFGFGSVLVAAVVAYLVALVALRGLRAPIDATSAG